MLWISYVSLAGLGSVWLLRRRHTLDSRIWWASWLVPGTALVGAARTWPSWLILRKAAALLLMPAGMLWLGLFAALVVARKRRRLGPLLLTIVVSYTTAGNPWVGTVLLRALEGPYAQIRPLEADRIYDAVFVLGAGSGVTPAGEPQLAPSGDRIRLAAALYRAGKARLLVTSGAGFEGRDLAAETRHLWVQLGIPNEAILSLPGALNTAQEIAAYAALLQERAWDRVGLVTSARHMRRAQALCRRQGLELDPLPADFRSNAPPPSFLGLIPQASGFHAVEMAAWEYLGALSVRLTGS